VKLITEEPSKGDLTANIEALLLSKAMASNWSGSSCLQKAQKPNGCTRNWFASAPSL